MPYDPDIEISLLIGNNCTRVIRPREVIAGGEDERYAQISLLGWGVIGRVCKSVLKSDSCRGVCQKVTATEIYQHFVVSTKAKEIISPEKVIKILESDFNVKDSSGQPYSVEDRRFMSILENNIKQRSYGHYEMPLPLKSDSVILPYNRSLAEKRWNQLRARFKKIQSFLMIIKLV